MKRGYIHGTNFIDVWDIIELNRQTLPEGLINCFYSSYYVSYRLFHYSDFINHSKTTGISIIESLFSCYLAEFYNIKEREEKYGIADELLDYDKKFNEGLWNLFCSSYLGTTDKIRPYQPPNEKVLETYHIVDPVKRAYAVLSILKKLLIDLVIAGADLNNLDELLSEIQKHVSGNFAAAQTTDTYTNTEFVFYAFALMKMSFLNNNFNTSRSDIILDAGCRILDIYFGKSVTKLEKRRYHRTLYNGQHTEHYTNFIELPLTFKSR